MLHLYHLLYYLYAFFMTLFKIPQAYRKQEQPNQAEKEYIPYSTQKKPEWVKNEVIKLKAYDKTLSHNKLSAIFNAKHDTISVGSTFVGYTLRDYAYEVQILRREIKAKPVHKVLFNATWGMDLTFINQVPTLGVVEHHSRKLLILVPLQQKSSVNILLALLSLLKTYPKPQQIRTDNESCFTSKLVKFALWFLGIKHQTIDKNCPWQNGRIERLFGTLKSTLRLINYHKEDLPYLTQSFAWWYNIMRLHMNLEYKTPQSVYEKQIDELYKRWHE